MNNYDTLPACPMCECPDCRWTAKAELGLPHCTHGPHCVLKLHTRMETSLSFVHIHLPKWKGFHIWTRQHP